MNDNITSNAGQMTQDSLVLFFILKIALQKALLHLVLFANRARANSVSADLGARVTLGLLGFEVDRIGARTRGVEARAEHVIQTLVALHAYGRSGGESTRVATAWTLARTALLARLQLTLVGLLAGVVTACLFAVCAVATVALFSFFYDTVSAQ